MKLSKRKPISIKSSLRIYSIAMAALPILVVGSIAYYILMTSMKQEIANNNLLLTRSLANEVEEFIAQPQNLLKEVKDIISRTDLISTDERNAYLEEIVKNYPFMELIMLINTRGRVIAVAPYNANIDGIDMSGKDFFQTVQARHTSYWSPTFIPPYADQPTISISIPFEEGMITGYLKLAALGGIVDKFNTGTTRSAVIVDNEGTVIAHPDRSLITTRWNLSQYGNIGKGFSGEEGVFSFEFEGKTYLGGVTVVPGVNWVVHISQTRDVAYAPIQRVGLITAVGMGIAMIMAVVISLPIMRKILNPLIRLTDQATHIARGDYRTVDSKGTFLEINELTESFNTMVAAVREREDQLRQSEAEISRHSVMLEETNRELKAAKNAAESANRAKTTFLANMSHELRTPLNSILGFTHLMRRNESLPTTLREEVGIINRSGQHLLALINDVLEIAKIETGRLSLNQTNFDLHWFLQGIKEMSVSATSSQELSFAMEIAPDLVRHVRADEGKLRQVLINLLGNAIKFTKAGRIDLRVSNKNSKETLWVRFEIEDTGVGIASGDLGRIFKPFVQSTSLLSDENISMGTGLGLAISRQYIVLMGGEIAVQSTPGMGTVFRFEIPVEEVAGNLVVHRQSRGRVISLLPDQPDYRILIVEDQEENRHLLRELMGAVGFTIEEAANGEEGVRQFLSWQPDLVWMDIRMPVMDGYEATRQIKATKKGARTPIIALTAHAFEEERDRILAAGCDDFVRKPFRPSEIFDIMAKHLGVRYQYEESTLPVNPRQQTPLEDDRGPDLLPRLPEDLVLGFKEAIVAIDTDLIRKYIDQINTIDPSLGRMLSRLADDFRYDRILSLIAPEEK